MGKKKMGSPYKAKRYVGKAILSGQLVLKVKCNLMLRNYMENENKTHINPYT